MKGSIFWKIHIFLCYLSSAFADIYLHNPRGSNNRLDEEGRDRNNANRLFDSQNNNRGGYNVGSVYYYVGSKLQMEWTNQHSCNHDNNHCEIIIQYMCDDRLRDGATTTTIPENPMDCENYDCNMDKRYGMHEDFDYYLSCKQRQRNMGLFTADQNLKGSSAKYTRQNPNGNRRGYECPEERDYYPYWSSSPWRDIVVMTNNASRCTYYQAESQNVKSRWQCVLPRELMYANMKNHNLKMPITEQECQEYTYPENDPNGAKGQWMEIPAHGIPPPDCMENQLSRDNHLGNGIGGYPLSYNWTIPDIAEEYCAIRIRYNISTQDYEAWEGLDASNNKGKGRERTDYAKVDLSPLVGLDSEEDAIDRGYVFENNPQVQIFEELDVEVQLAINTAQFGRTFQDRSHSFAVRRRPEGLEDVTIHNVNVRGKRGNIVQVYPAVEYDFIPNTLSVKQEDYVHFQWTGSNTNPNNNDGQGRRGTDRSNVVLQRYEAYPEGSGLAYTPGQKHGHWGRSYPNILDNTTFLGWPREDLVKLAMLEPHQFRGEMSELDDAGTYFDLGPRKVTMAGIYHYLSTRNNNFSNRSQKGRLIVRSYDMEQKSIGWNGGSIVLADGVTSVNVPKGAFEQLHNMRMEKWDKEEAKNGLEEANKLPPNDNLAGDAVVIHPESKLTAADETFEVVMTYSASPLQETVVYATQTSTQTWTRVQDVQSDGKKLRIMADRGGYYVATNQLRAGAVAGIVIGAIVVVALIVLGIVCLVRKPPPAVSRMFAAKI